MGVLRRSDGLLVLGMALGIAMAALGLLRDDGSGGPGLSRDGEAAVAVVGDQTISRQAFENALTLVGRDGRRRLDNKERHHILERLIDEELLLQQGLDLELPRSDRKLRNDVVAAVIDAATAEAGDAQPDDEQLQAFLQANRGLLRGGAALRVAQVFIASPPRDDAEAAARAGTVAARLKAGEDLGLVRRELGDPPAVELPETVQPEARLRDSIGPGAAEAALALEAGEVSEPLRAPDGYRVLVMLERREGPPLTLDANRARVLSEFRRQAGEAALREYLALLRSRTAIRRLEPEAGEVP